MKKPILALLAVVTLLHCTPVRAQENLEPAYRTLPVLTLQEVLQEARAFSPQLKSSQETIAQAQARVKLAYSMVLPFVTASANYTRTDKKVALDFSGFTDVFSLAAMNCANWDETTMGPAPSLCSATAASSSSSGGSNTIQDLNNFDAGLTVGLNFDARTFPQLDNVYTGRELAYLQQEFTEEQLLYSVTQLFYTIATTQAAVDLMVQNLANAKKHIELLEARKRVGVAMPNEAIRLEILLLQSQGDLESVNLGLEHARRSLSLLLGRSDSSFQVQVAAMNEGDEHTQAPEDEQLANRKDLLIQDKLELMAERGVTDIWMQFLPTLQAVWNWSASSNTGFSGDHTQWRAILTLNWNIFLGGSRLARLDEARSLVRQARYNREVAIQKARIEGEQAVSDILEGRRSLRFAMQIQELARNNLELVQRQYQLGAADQTLVLDADKQFRAAGISLIQSRFTLALANIAYTKAAGKFMELLGQYR